jgi:hypothetical protein
MALPPIVAVTIQSSIIGAISNILAQAITAHQNDVRQLPCLCHIKFKC